MKAITTMIVAAMAAVLMFGTVACGGKSVDPKHVEQMVKDVDYTNLESKAVTFDQDQYAEMIAYCDKALEKTAEMMKNLGKEDAEKPKLEYSPDVVNTCIGILAVADEAGKLDDSNKKAYDKFTAKSESLLGL